MHSTRAAFTGTGPIASDNCPDAREVTSYDMTKIGQYYNTKQSEYRVYNFGDVLCALL